MMKVDELEQLLHYWTWKLKRKFESKEKARMLVRIRDNFTCQACGDIRNPLEARRINARMFDVHHTGGACGKGRAYLYDSPKDIHKMITLCHKCHYNRFDHTSKLIRERKVVHPISTETRLS